MRFGFYCNWGLFYYGGIYYINAVDYKYVECACSVRETVTVLTTVWNSEPPSDYRALDLNNVSIIPIPPFSTYVQSLRFFLPIYIGLRRLSACVDYIYVRTPEPFSWLLLFVQTKAMINYHFASNPMELIIKNKNVKYSVRLLKALVFLPEFIMTCIAAYKYNCSANGSSVLRNIPFFLREKISVLHESTLRREEVNKKRFRAILSNDSFSFLSVGRIQNGKGIPELIEAFRRIKGNYPNVQFLLTIVGDGPLREELEERVCSYGLASEIVFKGGICNGPVLEAIYDSHDVFIMPSISETGPRVILEAMNSALLCVTTEVGYVGDILDRNSAIIISPGEVDELYSAILWVFFNKAAARRLAENGWKRSKYYTLESFFTGLLGS